MDVYYFNILDYSIKIDTSIFKEKLKNHIEAYVGKDRINSFFAYKLLSEKLNNFDIEFSNNGKPLCIDKYISITHSENMVAVAISNENVGIDLQCHKEISNSLINKVIPEDMINDVIFNNDLFFSYWTLMEAKCKFDDGILAYYLKSKVNGHTINLKDNNKTYTIGICSNDKTINIIPMEIKNGNFCKKRNK